MGRILPQFIASTIFLASFFSRSTANTIKAAVSSLSKRKTFNFLSLLVENVCLCSYGVCACAFVRMRKNSDSDRKLGRFLFTFKAAKTFIIYWTLIRHTQNLFGKVCNELVILQPLSICLAFKESNKAHIYLSCDDTEFGHISLFMLSEEMERTNFFNRIV